MSSFIDFILVRMLKFVQQTLFKSCNNEVLFPKYSFESEVLKMYPICENVLCSLIFHILLKLNPFILEFLKWTLPSPNLVRTIVPNRDLNQNQNKMTK